MDLDPTVLGHVVQVVDSSRGGIAMRRVVNGPLSEFNGLFHRQILSVVVVQDTVGVCRTTSDGKHLSLQARAIVINIIELGTLFVPAGNHGSHRQTVSAVGSHDIRQHLGGGCHRDAAAVSELVQPALHSEVALPEGTIGGTTGHGSQQKGVDFNDLFDGSRRDVAAHGRTRIDTDNDTALEFKGKGGGTLHELDVLSLVSSSADRSKVVAAVPGGIANIGNVELGWSSHHQGGLRRHGLSAALSSGLSASNIENIVAYWHWSCKFGHVG
mmetsp:Transcript_18541/g.45945  ORF Transcript_18541/g.45945 Transcript_18541/m.45945 type:complete len:270 (+) Transcript_18541:124-933(+)